MTADTWPDAIQKPGLRALWRRVMTIVEALLLLAAGTAFFEIAASLGPRPLPEIALYAEIKGGFAFLLAAIFSFRGGWRRYGFAGGLDLRRWPALLPLWLGTCFSLLEGPIVSSRLRILLWSAISLTVAFGEEGIFRGIILDAMLPTGPRKAVLVSAALFGASHLIGLVEIDPRIVIPQAFMAMGLGISLGWARIATGSIWPSLIAHMSLDAAGLLVADGVEDALHYTPEGSLFLAGFAAFTIGWGLFLLIRFPLAARTAIGG